MPSPLRILDPTNAATASSDAPAERSLVRLEGAVVGFIDNAKPNFEHLVDAIADELVARCGVRSVVKRRKRAASVPVPVPILEELAARCDLVIAGSGD
jgi:hypothetical protein